MQFTAAYVNSATVGADAGLVDDSIVVQTGSGGLIGTVAGIGTLFGNTTTEINSAPCRVKVFGLN